MYIKESLIDKQNKLIQENNELLKSVLQSIDDLKKGKYKVI
jgi:hypothetical protein